MELLAFPLFINIGLPFGDLCVGSTVNTLLSVFHMDSWTSLHRGTVLGLGIVDLKLRGSFFPSVLSLCL